ncbi:hypothetical protein TgHK011_000242 [Trichoderma gracile]|nr:hypothetical protein TgHK011_000242 [Trichoderma gracile]
MHSRVSAAKPGKAALWSDSPATQSLSLACWPGGLSRPLAHPLICQQARQHWTSGGGAVAVLLDGAGMLRAGWMLHGTSVTITRLKILITFVTASNRSQSQGEASQTGYLLYSDGSRASGVGPALAVCDQVSPGQIARCRAINICATADPSHVVRNRSMPLQHQALQVTVDMALALVLCTCA